MAAISKDTDSIDSINDEVQSVLRSIGLKKEFTINMPRTIEVLDIVQKLQSSTGELKRSFCSVYLLLRQNVSFSSIIFNHLYISIDNYAKES